MAQEHFIVKQLQVTTMDVFCYIVYDDKAHEGVCIDPAGDFGDIYRVLDENEITVKWIINTHGHYDHVSGNEELMKRTGAPLLIHRNDLSMIGIKDISSVEHFDNNLKAEKRLAFLEDGDMISFGNEKLKVIHTPGHSEGCISLYREGHIFTGDTLFTEGMGRTDLPGGSHSEIMNSIRNRILIYPDDTIVWPGHHYGRYPFSTVGEQKTYYK